MWAPPKRVRRVHGLFSVVSNNGFRGDLKMRLEKRNNNRLVLSVPMSFKVFQLENLEKDVQDKTLALKGEVQDMTQEGLLVISPSPFKSGDILELKMDIPGAGAVQTMAKVVWCKPEAGEYRSGVQFIPVREGDLRKLHEYFGSGSSA